jgi:hypothetical protein
MEVEVIMALSKMIAGKKVISEEEIKQKTIRAALRVLGLKLVSLDQEFINRIVASLIDVPISLSSPHYSERVEMGNVVLYHLHTVCPTQEEFEEAYVECMKSRQFLVNVQKMKAITDRFFEGYDVTGEFMREYSNRGYSYLVFYSTLEDLEQDIDIHLNLSVSSTSEYVVVIPTEKSLKPFLRFFRRHSEDVKKAGMKIWVTNTEKLTIDPFIGYPKDFRLLSRFKNPKVASMIASLWRTHVEDVDLD